MATRLSRASRWRLFVRRMQASRDLLLRMACAAGW